MLFESEIQEEVFNEEDDDEFEEIYEGSKNGFNQLHGRGTIYFNIRKTERFEGRFHDGVKNGKGTFFFNDGSSLAGTFVDDCMEGKGMYTNDDGSYIVGTYSNGELNGYAEEFDKDGRLVFQGNYINNLRSGICHFHFEFGGRLFGVVDKLGKFSGKDFVYVYPDEKTLLKGSFENGDMVLTCLAVYCGIGDQDNPHSYKKIKRSLQYCKDMSTYDIISSLPLQSDPYETKRVMVKQSTITDANEGLFSTVKADAGEVMSFYNGIRISHSEVDARDWTYNDNTISLNQEIVIDVPSKWSSTLCYCASVGHKANHSFEPNSKYDRFHHPRFGAIKCIRTIKPVEPGDELTVAYGYDHEKLETDAPMWYREKLERWKNNNQPT